MNKVPTLTDKELKKWIGILGHKRIKYLFIYNKIKLTNSQLEYVIESDKNEKSTNNDRNTRDNNIIDFDI